MGGGSQSGFKKKKKTKKYERVNMGFSRAGHSVHGSTVFISAEDRQARRNQRTLERRRRQRAHRRQAIAAASGAEEKGLRTTGPSQPTKKTESQRSHQTARNRRRTQQRRLQRRLQKSRTIIDNLVQSVTHRSETTAKDVELIVGHDWKTSTVPEVSTVPGKPIQSTQGLPATTWYAVCPSC